MCLSLARDEALEETRRNWADLCVILGQEGRIGWLGRLRVLVRDSKER